MKKILLTTAAALALYGCATTSTSVTPAQVITDLTGALSTISTVETLLVKNDPQALTAAQQATVEADLSQAQAALASLSAGLPATQGASKAAVVDGYVNDVLNVVAQVVDDTPGLSSFAPPVNAVDALMPAVEAFVNQYLPASVTTASAMSDRSTTRREHSGVYTAQQARGILHLPTVE